MDAAGQPIMMHSLTDVLINAEVLLSKDDATVIAWVVFQAVNLNGKVIGTWNANPILNALVYKCDFDNGTIREYLVKLIASKNL